MFAIVWSIISPAGARYSMNSSRALSLFLILYSTVRSKWVHLILYSTVYSASGPKQVGLQFFAGQYSTVPVIKTRKHTVESTKEPLERSRSLTRKALADGATLSSVS